MLQSSSLSRGRELLPSYLFMIKRDLIRLPLVELFRVNIHILPFLVFQFVYWRFGISLQGASRA